MPEKSTSYLYVHGGPGFSSGVVQTILEPLFVNTGKAIYFWNEPSSLRLEDFKKYNIEGISPWERYARSLKVFIEENIPDHHDIHLIVHSFGVHVVSKQYSYLNPRLKSLTIISPAFHLDLSHKNIIEIAIRDFAKKKNPKAEQLQKLLENYNCFFDEKIEEAMNIVMTDEDLFANYWKNHQIMNIFIKSLENPLYTFDPMSFFEVLRSMRQEVMPPIYEQIVDTPTLTIFGEKDPVIDVNNEMLYLNENFSNYSLANFENSRHWPHLEESHRFFTLMNLK